MNGEKRPSQLLIGFIQKASFLWILLVTVQLVTSTALWGGDITSEPVILQVIRAGRYSSYSTVIFEFDDQCQFDKPVLHGDEVRFRLKNVKTTLVPYREYNISESWVKLEKADNHLNVQLGLLRGFLKFTHSVLTNPDRLVFKLYRDESDNVSPSEKTAADSEDAEPTVAKERLLEDVPQGIAPPSPKTTLPERNIHLTESVGSAPIQQKQEVISQSPEEQLLTLNFYQVNIREILSALAMQHKKNIVVAQNVSGEVSVHLYQVPFDKALTAICRAGGFRYHKPGDVYYVFKPKEPEEPEAERLKMRLFKLEYADVGKIQEVLQAIPGMRMIKIHEPSKTVVMEDTPENIEKVESLIRFWDTKPKQVMIEAKILEIFLTDDMVLGVNWEQILGDVRIGTGGFSAATMPTEPGISPIPAVGEGIFGNIITGAGTGHQFTAALDALQEDTTINTISAPKILAIHGKPAKVQVGGKQGYEVTTISDGIATTSIEFIDTGTILEITPYIDDENNVLLKVQPSINTAELEEGIPVVRSTAVSTWLMAKNGETVFIGGLIQNAETEIRSGLPCLGNIPLLGLLFGRSSQGTKKTELIVLITPQIVESGARKDQEVIRKTEEMEKHFEGAPLPFEKSIRTDSP
jgi:type IV pilus secretin PilQ/predicted competence protein